MLHPKTRGRARLPSILARRNHDVYWLIETCQREIDCGFMFLKNLYLIGVFWMLYIFPCLATVPRVTPGWWIPLEQFSFKCRKVIDFALTTLHDWHRVDVFIWVSVIQSEMKPKPMELTCTRFPALHVNYMNLLRVLTGSLYFLYPWWLFLVFWHSTGHVRTWLRSFQDKLLYLVLFSLYPSRLGIERQKKLKKFTISSRKPRIQVRISIYRTWSTTKGQRSKRQLSNLFTVANFTLSTQLIKTNYLVILPSTQHHSFLRNVPPLFYWKLFHLIALWLVICTSVLRKGLKRDSDKAKTVEKVYIHLTVVIHQGLMLDLNGNTY